jgi:hypothetical protein
MTYCCWMTAATRRNGRTRSPICRFARPGAIPRMLTREWRTVMTRIDGGSVHLLPRRP